MIYNFILVEEMGFEPMTLRSRTARATNCATPRKIYYINLKYNKKVK